MGYFTDCKFDSPLDMLDAINETVERNVYEQFDMVSADKLGLDIRCGRVEINLQDEVIAVNCARGIDYYGGFEYIKEGEGRTTVGNYTFFTTESSRVQECFDYFNETISEEQAGE
jgi:hypothetical protein